MKSKILLSLVLMFAFLFAGCDADVALEDTEEYQAGFEAGYDAGYEACLNDIEEDYENNPDSVYAPVEVLFYYVDTQETPLNIREAPFQESMILGQIPKGENIIVTDIDGNYGYTCYDDVFGWVNLEYCAEGENPNPPAEYSSETVYVTNYGECYHKEWCGSLWKSKIPISLEDAEKNYVPCDRCF